MNTVDIDVANGDGRPLPSSPSNGNPQQKLNSLADIRSIMVSPSVTKAWLRSLMIDFAVAKYPEKIVTAAGAISLERDSFRSFMAQKLRIIGYRTKVKIETFRLPDGGFGLSQDIIQSLDQSVVFDQSSFSERVGEFSFPMIALFYATVLAEVPAAEKLARYSLPTLFADITFPALRNQFEGWRLWQRMFANQDAQVAGSINSLDWWRQLLESAVVD